jgi:tetratricopeptide (TPR) repeat protein
MAASCVSSPDERNADATLSHVEDIMSEYPDSALRLLSDSNLHPQTQRQKALYALLLTQARHKNYIDETNDSLITTAVDYFDRKGDEEHLMLALYYYGIIKSNAHNFASAIVSLMKAEALAQQNHNYLYIGRSCHYIAEIYNKSHSSSDEVRYDRKAYEAFKASNDTVNLRSATESLIAGLNNSHRYDEAIELAKEMYKDAIARNDTIFIGEALKKMGFSYHHLGNFKESADAYLHYKALSPHKCTPKLYYFLTTALWNAGEKDAATRLIDSVLNVYGEKAMIHPDILYEMGRKDDAYIQQKRAFSDANTAIGKILSQNVSASVSQYYAENIALKDLKAERNRILAVCIGVIAVVLILFFSRWILLAKRERARKEDEIMNLTRELSTLSIRLNSASDKLTHTTEELDRASQELKSAMIEITNLSNEETINLANISKLKKERFSIILTLSELYKVMKQNGTLKMRVADKAINIAHEFTSDPNLMSELEERINMERDRIMIKFREQMPNLSDNEYWIFIWGAFRISPSTVEFAWRWNRNSYYTLRRRLREKISEINPPDASIFLDILS